MFRLGVSNFLPIFLQSLILVVTQELTSPRSNHLGEWRGDVLLHVLLYTWVIFFIVRYDIE